MEGEGEGQLHSLLDSLAHSLGAWMLGRQGPPPCPLEIIPPPRTTTQHTGINRERERERELPLLPRPPCSPASLLPYPASLLALLALMARACPSRPPLLLVSRVLLEACMPCHAIDSSQPRIRRGLLLHVFPAPTGDVAESG